MIPTKKDNPNGLHGRYRIEKVLDEPRSDSFGNEIYYTEPVDKDSEYFVMRLDNGGKDPVHIAACRKAVLYYAELIKDHLPKLSKDLIERYGNK